MEDSTRTPITREKILDVIGVAHMRAADDGEEDSDAALVLGKLYDRLSGNEHLLKNVFSGDEKFKV